MTLTIGVPDHARDEWEQLHDTLAAHQEPAPCAGPDRDHWTGSAAQQQQAAARCLDCPAMVACATYARTAGERDGTWGGLTAAERRPPKPARRKPVKKPRKAAKR